ncbi:ribonuclease Z [Nocardia shimofusensis]|uniref:ribonuclease Z n=1 Tax=Nocardia shimofusensis TaxID=228596 RepID=UPI0008294EA5|nr:ribonuclease Z [Nocardia shimofusensis]
MSQRELIVLGTGSQVPTKLRNHNGYVVRWGREGLLFDPGEGTQRQMAFAGVSVSDLTHIALTHFHGDHCLGLPGIVQRVNLDEVAHPIDAYYPASGQVFFDRLCQASAFYHRIDLRPHPVTGPGVLDTPDATFQLRAVPLSHPVEAFGYRLTEPASRRMLPDRLRAFGIRGPRVAELQRAGSIVAGDRTVTLDEVSEPRPGQSFAFVMDTRLCPGVLEAAAGVDMLVIEATFLDAEAHLAEEHGHLTAGQAARAAAEAGVRTLVLTHFSQRYRTLDDHRREAEEHFPGELFVAEDLQRIPFPARQ